MANLSKETRLAHLRQIFRRINLWSDDAVAVPRNLSAIQVDAKVAIVGEAVGPKTLRVSGVSYFSPSGQIGRTGAVLDEILRPLGYTVYPLKKVKVPQGTIDHIPGGDRKTAYCTDVCPEFPGYCRRAGRTMIRKPSPDRILSAISHRFLREELEIIQPKLILLLGAKAYQVFYRYFLNRPLPATLSLFSANMQNTVLPTYRDAVVAPIFHPSPSSRSFHRWFGDFPDRGRCSQLIRSLKQYLLC